MRIFKELEISNRELSFRTARSGGPGGQHVNTTDTRVILQFDVLSSEALSPQQKQLVQEKLASRISKAGILRVSSQRHRSQFQNRQAVVEKFVRLLEAALRPRAPRVSTGVPEREKQKLLRRKRRQAEKKRQRSGKVVLEPE